MARSQSPVSREEVFSRIGYTPHSEQQWDAHLSPQRFKIPTCGRRWGKTTFAGHEFTYQMFAPDTYWWIVGPTYQLGEKEFRIIRQDFIKLGVNKIKGWKCTYNPKQGDMKITLPWNTILEVKSATQPDSLLGEGLDGVIMSESARHSMETWQMYIEPALSDRRGMAIFPSTPRGYNWYQGMWLLGQDPQFEDYISWRFPSWTNAAVFPGGFEDEEIQRMKQQFSSAYFRQEIGAEFTAFEGQIYEEFDPAIHVIDIDYNPAWKNYRAFDFGFKDPLVCLDIMVDPMDNVYVWREYMVKYLSTYEHAIALESRANPEGYHVNANYGDPRGADEIATFATRGVNILAPAVPWIQGIEVIKRHLKLQADGKPKLYFDRSCVRTIPQFEQLRHKEVKEGKNVTREGQHDYDDHGPDALRYFFGPHFVLYADSHLSDVYATGGPATEATTFFQLHQGFKGTNLWR